MKRTTTLLCALGLFGLAGLTSPAASVETPGFLKYEWWAPPLRDAGLTGTDVGILELDPNYAANIPDMTSYTVGFNTRAVLPDDSMEEYGVRLSGWITSPVTGDYNFYIASDDASQLFISSDQTEANLTLQAEEIGCCKGFLEPGAAQTTLSPIRLVAGQKYAVRIMLKEGGGGDYVQVAMQEASGTTPAAQLKPLVSTMLSSTADPAGASVNITQQPASISTPENAPSVSFSIAATAVTPYGKYTSSTPITNFFGEPLKLGAKSQIATFYQWFTNGVEVPGANGTNFSITWPKKSQNGMKVKCYVAVPGVPVYSSEATLTVTADTTAPTVVKAAADVSFTTVVVNYSEPVSDSALSASKYQVDQGVSVSSVTRIDPTTVKLTTSKMVENKLYTLTINDVQDTATPAITIATNTKVQFQSFVYVAGAGIRQRYDGFNNDAGYNINNLFNSPKFPNSPDRRSLTKRMEFPDDAAGNVEMPNWPSTEGREFFDTVEVWFTPPVTTNYVFFTAFADHSWVYLSTDENPANKVQVILVDGWTDPRMWLTGHDLDMTRTRTDQNTQNQWATAPTISLQAGKRYYMLMAHHQPTWGGGQYYATTYKIDGEADPTDGSAPKLEKSAIGIYLDPSVGGNVAFSQQPTNVTAYAGTQVTFYSAASGSSPYTTNVMYQWQSAPKGSSTFTDIPGATAATYSPGYVVAGDDGKQFRVVAMVPPAMAVSTVATATVLVDEAPPTIVKVATDASWNTITLTYSEPVTDTALATSRYQLDQGITVTSVSRIDSLTYQLTTSPMTENKTYKLTVNGVKDAAGNTIAVNTLIDVRTLVFITGSVLHKKYDNFDNGAGGNPANLFSDPRYPDNADREDMLTAFEYPPGGVGRIAADPVRNYFDTIEGYFLPPTTGDYVFFTCGADRWWFYLSTDESPANMHLVAAQPGGWTNPRGWNTGQGGTDMVPARTDTYAATEWPDGNKVTLQAGKRYYMMEIHHDPSWSGGDQVGATYTMEGEAVPNAGDPSKLTGSVIGYYFDPNGASVEFTSQPQNQAVVQGQTATFSVVAVGSSAYGSTVFYEWQSAPKGSSNWTPIPGATAAAYTTPILGVANDGTQFRVIASVPPYSLASSVATLTVAADTTAPVVSAGAMLDEIAGVVDVGIGFDETVDSAVGVLANYSVSPGTITGISVYTNRFTDNSQNPMVKILKQTVLLKVTGLTGSGTLTVKNVGDVYGNKITTVNVPFTVDTKLKWGVVGGHEFLPNGGWNAVVPVAPNGFDIYSDGVGAWAQYDEATLVYEQITGDFDKKLRVAYQDGSTTWARAGLIAKEATAFGMDRATQEGGAAVRYQKCLVYPVGATLSGPGLPATGTWSLNRRLDVGGASSGANMTGPNSTPAYPNAWCRLKRVGQTFSMYRSDDGVNWVLLGSTTWGVDDASKSPMPATLFVGPDYAPEINAVTLESDRGTFMAQFRDYGDYSSVFDPQLKGSTDASGKTVITWTTGTLVSSPTVGGTYSPVDGATSPYTVDTTKAAVMFYRVRQ